MKIIRIVCLITVVFLVMMFSGVAQRSFVHGLSTPPSFGYTDTGTAFVVDTGAGLVFEVRKTDGSITSIVFNGTEYRSTTGRFSQIASGLGTPTTVTADSDGATFVKITIQTGPTNGVAANLTHYLVVRNGENTIYMATFPTAEPNVGELRWITRLNYTLIPNGPPPSDLNGNTGAIESTDIFGMADGTTRSKYYGDTATRGKDRAMELTYNGAIGPGIGCWMVFGNRESSSGGPFFRDIENQAGTDQEIYNYMNSGHNQTEPYRLNVLHGPYALVFTSGDPPSLPLDFSWMESLGLTGWVPASGRGAISGIATGIPTSFQGVMSFANSAAQYWATVAADGTYTSSGIKPGTYTATLYKGELAVATSPVTVNPGETTTLNLASGEIIPSSIFRIGEWDGTPSGFMNGEKIVQMHPQDVRMTPWDTTTYTVGIDSPSMFPAIQFRGKNSPTTIKFNLAANQIVELTLRIGITCAYNNGRPQVTVNSFTSPQPPASNQPDSRSFTLGTYRGNNALFTFNIPASALVIGTNTLTINPISGSTDLGTWLSAGWVYDAVELEGPIATPVITYVGGNPLTISGTSEPFRNIALTLDASTPAGNTVAASNGNWTINFAGSLSAGSHSFTAAASDNFGHSSPASAPYTFNTNVVTPEITAAIGDSGTHTSGATTSDRTFVFNGIAGAGDTIVVTRVGTGVIANLVADGSGNWNLDYTGVALPAGVNSFYATATNANGTSPSSAIFTLNIEGTPRITIVRFNPTTPTITSGVSSVVFRVTFRDFVNGVTTNAFAISTTGSASGTIVSVSAGSGTVFDVAVDNLSGTGTLRLDLKPINGIVDANGNPQAGYHAGESYTLVLPTFGNGTWIQSTSGGLWSDPANWLNAIIADGSANSANFATLDLTTNNTVHLDSPRTLSSLVFGDTNATSPAGWLVDNNGAAANSLTLAGTAPSITVNSLGTGATTTISAALFGTGGLNKAGPGTLVLSNTNPLTGPLNINGGALQLPSGGSLNLGNNAVNTALNTQLRVTGGSFTTSGLVTSVTSSVVIDSGTGTLGSFRTNSDFSATLRINGGTLTCGDVNIRRNSAATPDFASGFIVAGGTANAGTIELGNSNSNGAMSVEGGALTATGRITIGNNVGSTRGGAMRVTNGQFTSTDSANGIVLTATSGNASSAAFNGGTSNVEKFTFGLTSSVTTGSGTLTLNGGTLYLGGGGLVRNAGGTYTTAINLTNGTLGANANWTTTLPMTLSTGANINLKSADAANNPFNISLNGVIGGAGGFTKTGGGSLLLAAANTFTGPVTINAGTLEVDGSIAASATNVTVNSGGTLTGDGTINRSLTLNASGRLEPGSSANGSALNASSLTWNGDGIVAVNLGASSNQLNLTGALNKGAAGAHTFVFTPDANLAINMAFTLVTFSATDFTAAELSYTGLPAGLVGIFTVNANSIAFEVFTPPAIVTQPQDVVVPMGGTANFFVVATGSPVLNYQWFKDITAIAGATNSSFTVSNVQAADISSYSVQITNIAGTVTSDAATLSIAPIALVNHAPTLNTAVVQGSLEQMLGESVSLNGKTSIAGDLLVPGLPDVVLSGSPDYGGTIDGTGNTTPSNYGITLNTNTSLGHVIRRTDPIPLPTVSAPVAPTGTRSVTLNNSKQNPGDWATLRDLTLTSGVGQIAVPAGAYGGFTATGASGFVLGEIGSTQPLIYHFQNLALNNAAQMQVVGPVIVIVGNGFTVNGGIVGAAANPTWLTLNIFSGGVTLNSGASVYGYLTAPTGTLTIGGNCRLLGNAAVDRLAITNNGQLVIVVN